MSSQTSSFTDSALSDKVKEFLTRFKDKQGNYKYVDAIDAMMPKNAKYIVVDYNDLVTEPQIEIIFSENPDRIFDAFARAIKEALQTRFPDYAEKIKEEVEPDPNIKVGINSGKIINGINKLCCRKLSVKAEPKLPIKLREGVPISIDKDIYINKLFGKAISKLNTGVIKRSGRKFEIQCTRLLTKAISEKDRGPVLYKSRVPSI